MKNKIFVFCAALITVIALFSGCTTQENKGTNVQEEMSFTEIKVGDKPTTEDFSHLNITFSEIKLHKSGDNNSGWVNLTLDNKTVDLLYLHVYNLTEQLGIMEIEIGNYDKLWINISKAIGVINETGENKNITVPSGWLKIQQLHLFNITKGNNTITVDIDLENSLHAYAGGTEFKLSPVISGLEYRHENQLVKKHTKGDEILENQPPVIEIIANGTRGKSMTVNVDVNESITFNASESYDPEGENLTFYWDFGDGTNSTNSIVEHNYTVRGNYTVTLTVSDGTLDTSETFHVNVKEKGGPY